MVNYGTKKELLEILVIDPRRLHAIGDEIGNRQSAI